MSHRDNRLALDNRRAHLLKAAQEHPTLHGNHCGVALILDKVKTALDKARAEVALHVGVVLLDPLAHEWIKAAAAHIRRIRNGAGKTTGQLLADGGSAFELSFGRSGKKVIGTTRGGSLELVDLVL